MSKYDKQAQDWVCNPHAWQEHEEDHVAEQFKVLRSKLWKLCKVTLMCLFCLAAVSGWALWL